MPTKKQVIGAPSVSPPTGVGVAVIGTMILLGGVRCQRSEKPLDIRRLPWYDARIVTKTYRIKALCRATSKVMLIRASSEAMALKKVSKLKEHRDVYIEYVVLDVSPDDRLKAI